MAIFLRSVCAAALLLATVPAFAAAPTPDCSAGAIAATPVAGTVKGHKFTPKTIEVHITHDGMEMDGAKFDRYELSIIADGIFNALTVNMLVPLGKKPDGRVFRSLPIDSIGGQPAAAPGLPEIQGWDLQLEEADVDTSFTQDTAAIRVEWGTAKGAVLPGKIHFCSAGSDSDIAGSFDATLR
jgi:hypothetical protein